MQTSIADDNEYPSPESLTSNCAEFLATCQPEITERALQTFSEDDVSKALGLSWNPLTDQFLFKINWIEADQTTWTKRQFLAETSRLFDPLGWLAPITIKVKIVMQEIWLSKIGWDELISTNIAENWAEFRQEFKELEKIKIDRWVGFEKGCEISLHGFSDASEKAYSAAVYLRVEIDQKIIFRLITAKSRVRPRLELCGALLVSNLMNTVKRSLRIDDTYLWTDSMITYSKFG